MIPADDVLDLIRRLLEFPYPQICRHLVACDLLSLLEKHGWECSTELADAVVRCHDDGALKLIDQMKGTA